MFFGDLLQLPPVKGNQPFIQVSFLEAKQRVGAIASLNLWKTLAYDALASDMRQNGDKHYANILSAVRTGRITDQQFSTLSNRLISRGRRASVKKS